MTLRVLTPISSLICIRHGVPPRMCPTFRSCIMSPATPAAQQTTPATASTVRLQDQEFGFGRIHRSGDFVVIEADNDRGQQHKERQPAQQQYQPLSATLRDVTLNLDRIEDGPVIACAEAVYAAELGLVRAPPEKLRRLRQATEILRDLRRDRPEVAAELFDRLREFADALALLDLSPAGLESAVRPRAAFRWSVWNLGYFLVGVPIAAIPLLWLVHRHLLEGRNPLACFGIDAAAHPPEVANGGHVIASGHHALIAVGQERITLDAPFLEDLLHDRKSDLLGRSRGHRRLDQHQRLGRYMLGNCGNRLLQRDDVG